MSKHDSGRPSYHEKERRSMVPDSTTLTTARADVTARRDDLARLASPRPAQHRFALRMRRAVRARS